MTGISLTDAQWTENIRLAYELAGLRMATDNDIAVHKNGGNPNSVLIGFRPEVAARLAVDRQEEEIRRQQQKDIVALQAAVGDLSTRPTKAELETALSKAAVSAKNLEDAEKVIEELRKQLEDKPPVVEPPSVVDGWFKRVLQQIIEWLSWRK